MGRRSRSYDLGPIDSIPPGEGREFLVGQEAHSEARGPSLAQALALAVFRGRDGSVFACAATCPHGGGPLADGIFGGGRIICPYHAYSFDLRTGQPMGAPCDALRVHPASIDRRGHVVVEAEVEVEVDGGGRNEANAMSACTADREIP